MDPDKPGWIQSLRLSLTSVAERGNTDPRCLGFCMDNEIHVSSDPALWEKYDRAVIAAVRDVGYRLYKIRAGR